MQKGRSIEDIYDLLALRIVVDSVEDYRILGLVRENGHRFQCASKIMCVPNLTLSIASYDHCRNQWRIFEIQIRTYEMDCC